MRIIALTIFAAVLLVAAGGHIAGPLDLVALAVGIAFVQRFLRVTWPILAIILIAALA
jgi:ABC-type Fe3+ transport system permease subunit